VRREPHSLVLSSACGRLDGRGFNAPVKRRLKPIRSAFDSRTNSIERTSCSSRWSTIISLIPSLGRSNAAVFWVIAATSAFATAHATPTFLIGSVQQ
jgi:hypothetical protein